MSNKSSITPGRLALVDIEAPIDELKQAYPILENLILKYQCTGPDADALVVACMLIESILEADDAESNMPTRFPV